MMTIYLDPDSVPPAAAPATDGRARTTDGAALLPR